MFKLQESSARAVAARSRTAMIDVDSAYVAQLRFAAGAIEAIQGAGLPVGQSQKLMRTIQQATGKLVDGRGDLVSVMAQLLVIQKNSNIAETDLGCTTPWNMPLFFTGSLEQVADDAEYTAETG